MRFALASGNPGKLRELRRLLPDWEIDPLETTGIGDETGSSFYENARQKALFARSRAPAAVWALGEDSGLEVDGLGGDPGIRSARFAGEGSSDGENVAKLLADLEGVPPTSPRPYVCELVALSPDGSEARARGTLDGWIAGEPAGTGGFGYDPVFLPAGESTTIGVLGDEWKALRSHRAEAARSLARVLGTHAGSTVDVC